MMISFNPLSTNTNPTCASQLFEGLALKGLRCVGGYFFLTNAKRMLIITLHQIFGGLGLKDLWYSFFIIRRLQTHIKKDIKNS